MPPMLICQAEAGEAAVAAQQSGCTGGTNGKGLQSRQRSCGARQQPALSHQAQVAATPNQLMAQLLAASLNQLWTISNGFLIPYPMIPRGGYTHLRGPAGRGQRRFCHRRRAGPALQRWSSTCALAGGLSLLGPCLPSKDSRHVSMQACSLDKLSGCPDAMTCRLEVA